MLKSLLSWFKLKRVIQNDNESGLLLLGPNVKAKVAKTAKVILKNGTVRIGFHLRDDCLISTKPETCILLEEGSSLIFEGNAIIAPGATIRVKKNATFIIGKNTLIAHDFFALCNNRISIGSFVSISWNTTLIDNDGHTFFRPSGTPIRRFSKPLIIQDNCGLQMNVVIPSGVTIQKGAVIAANTTIRQDIPAASLVYSKNELVVKDNVTSEYYFKQ